jgi:2-polyprenyl-6-methoxyphenol hydroxylase-like FAD-dependent oxidoreductase
MAERVLVIGAGMAGLCVALALAPTGRQILLLERDPPPPDGDADAVFAQWERRGVGQIRHSHAFLARFRNIIRDAHPRLLQALSDAGCRELGLEAMLTDLHRERYRPRPEDADLVFLASRRTTLETVIRRYVEQLPGVEIRSGAFVRQLLVEKPDLGPPVVAGVSLDTAQGPRHVLADFVVDAAGRTSQGVEQLIAAGAAILEEAEPSGILYFTRHFRLLDGQAEPARGGAPSTGDLGYIKFGVFPGDNGRFSITLCLPEAEPELRQAVASPEGFDAVCRRIPGLAPWLEPDRTEGRSRVYGMGDLQSRWRDLAPRGQPAVLGYAAVGDSLIRTNPFHGRGCAFAAVQAFILRDVLASVDDPAERAVAFRRQVRTELRAHFTSMRRQDRSATRRAHRKRAGDDRPRLGARLLHSFVRDGVAVAVRSDPDVLREALRAFHMLDAPGAWLRRPPNLIKVLGCWARGRDRTLAAHSPAASPRRDAMLRELGLAGAGAREPG